MRYLDFIAECKKRCIEPSIAAENENIVAALKDVNDDLVIELLDKEF